MLRIIDNKAKKRIQKEKNGKKRIILVIDNKVIIFTELYEFVFYVVFNIFTW